MTIRSSMVTAQDLCRGLVRDTWRTGNVNYSKQQRCYCMKVFTQLSHLDAPCLLLRAVGLHLVRDGVVIAVVPSAAAQHPELRARRISYTVSISAV